jgi:ABC-type sugar transport system permease subunit
VSSRRPVFRHLVAWLALAPMVATVVWVYVGSVLWSMRISVSSSRTLPINDWVGLRQYTRLFDTERWTLSLENMALFGVLFIVACLAIGFLLAVFIDQRVKGEGLLRTVFLYPYAMSFVATGLVWQWMLNPELGLQATVRKNWGFPGFTFDWIVRQDAVHVRHRRRRRLAGLRPRDGADAGRPARHRREPVDGRAHRRHSTRGASTPASCCRCWGRRSAPRSCCCR